jgi:argininosuccinate lyase
MDSAMAAKTAPQKTAAPIWSKRASSGPSAVALAYTAGRDVAGRPPADEVLIPYDIWTNRAHCTMLRKVGIIDAKTARGILRGLAAIEADYAAGRFTLDPTLEDVHMNIERAVAARAGDAIAGAMHTARSRNDQSCTDVRLWLRDQLLSRLEAVAALIRVLADFAKQHARTIAPGWTHAQPAMPTTLGHWAAGHAQALARDAEALQALWPLINVCPLGAAASFGSSWPIDRALTAKRLGFAAPQRNSLDSISTRWEAEARVGAALALLMTHLSSLGQDLIFLSSPPRALIRLSDAHVTGSSIMPNKRNPDFCEVTRARAATVHALLNNLLTVCRGALSGYNRDTQWSKYWIMDLVDEVGVAPEVFAEAIAGISVDTPALKKAATDGFALAADFADLLAHTRRLPFRKTYHVVAEAVATDEKNTENPGWLRLATVNAILTREKIKPLLTQAELDAAGDPAHVLAARNSQGGPAPDDVKAQAAELLQAAKTAQRWTAAHRKALAAARAACR